jgi:hypothetical protein
MAYEAKVNECFAFLNEKGDNPHRPDYKGTIVINEPGTYDVALWKGEVGKEKKYKGINIKLSSPYKKNNTTTNNQPNKEGMPF